MISLDSHISKFRAFAKSKHELCEKDPSPLELKLEHTLEVLSNAEKIALGENMPPHLLRACQLAALYHDIARFDQYLLFNTFKDALSFNHALEAVRILEKTGFLEDEPMRKPILTAIACHNKPFLPEKLGTEDLLLTNVLRNADKLDILRVIAGHLEQKPYNPTVILSLPDDETICGEKVISAAMESRVPLYGDLRTVNDFRVLLGLWFYDLQFETSRRLFLENGHANKIVSRLPDNKFYGVVRSKLLNLFNSCCPKN